MIKSMTGYGKGEVLTPTRKITAEIRCVNSKTMDVYLRAPYGIKSYEIAIRTMMAETLQRGKMDILITVENTAAAQTHRIQFDLAALYIEELRAFAKTHDLQTDQLLPLVARIPDVITPIGKDEDTSEWSDVEKAVKEAIAQAEKFRLQEGSKLMQEFKNMVTSIQQKLEEIAPFEKERMVQLRQNIQQHIREFLNDSEFDKNRMEQELFYYIEKLDLTEEHTRLKAHCEYFLTTLTDPTSNGRKLGFIAQEMGREINTIGSKANHAGIQKKVVEMKDELEKIKEQLMNIL